jgi:hypothetical protein
MLTRLFAGAACLCALVFVSGAQAAPAWLPAQDLSTTGRDALAPKVALDASGNALVIWRRAGIVQAAEHSAGGSWEAPADLSAAGQEAVDHQVAVDPAGNAIAVWYRSNGMHDIVQAAVRPARGSWQAAQDLSVLGQDASTPYVAFDLAGNAIAVWSRLDGSNFIVQAAFRPAGGSWQLPAQDLTVPGHDAAFPQVAFDAAGNAIAAWHRSDGANYVVQAAFRPAGGGWQLPAQTLSLTGANAFSPQLAVDPAGNAVAVWERASVVQAAVRPVGGPWQPADNLSLPAGSATNPQVALGETGSAVAVWQGWNGMNYIIRASMRPLSGIWQPAEDLSALGESAFDPQVALDPAGNAVAVWKRPGTTNIPAQAAVRPVGGPWQPPTDVSASTLGVNAESPQVAIDPAGNALAVWQWNTPPNYVVQATAYDVAGPIVRAVAIPAGAFARQRLTFSLDAFDAWSALAPPVWTFGDGKSATGQTVTHTFARGGAYTVGVTQADAVGNVSAATRTLTLRVARCFGKAATRVGTSGPDRIVGTRRADVIVTLAGNDRVRGRGGNDRICGGKGRDRLAGGAGNDLLNGGPGRDICSQGGGRGRLVAC